MKDKLEDHIATLENIHLCPVCAKLHQDEKGLYLHIMRAHPQDQSMAYALQADLYRRWQKRSPQHEQ
jgi:hypothetical protein